MRTKTFTIQPKFLSLAFVALVASTSAVEARTTQDLANSRELSLPVRQTLQSLIDQNRIDAKALWADSAFATLQAAKVLSENEALAIRENSELSVEEVKNAMRLEGGALDEKARRSRPSITPDEALYVDFYQESPVLIDYVGEGNVVKEMSFGVVYKYLKGDDGKVRPHFVRAQLISPGTSGHRTSIGEFSIDRRHRYYVSQTYGSRMDYAQFFIGGIALHQTPEENYPKLGMPASHGCVRHHELDADAMWNLIGEAREDGHLVNIKVYSFGVEVKLADGSLGTVASGFGKDLNEWLNANIECTRRGDESSCTKSWDDWN